MEKKYKVNAKWTPDCQDKWDFDGEILSISSRYWGSRDYTKHGGKVTKPSAKSYIKLSFHEDEGIKLVEKEFEGDTKKEVKQQVEDWVQSEFDRLIEILKNAYTIK